MKQQIQSLLKRFGLLQPDNKNKPRMTLAFCFVAIFVIVGVGVYFFVNKSEDRASRYPLITTERPINSEVPFNAQGNFISEVKNEAFIATEKDGFLDISIFNPVENKVIASKKIALDAFLAPASTNSAGANDSVQYNSKTKEIFFSTQGYSVYDGSCTNKDGTCTSRLYKISLDQISPVIVFESKNPPKNWIINDFDNSLLLGFLDGKTQSIKKINGQNGKVIFAKDYQIKKYIELADFVVSEDGKYTYQASKESIDGKFFYEILRLRKIDNLNGNIVEQEIFGGEAIEYETSISPDNKYLAFYSGARAPARLYIYEISEKKLINVPYEGSIRNSSLRWSGDSKKLLYMRRNFLTYYDILSAKIFFIDSDDLQQDEYVFAWSPSVNYFLYGGREGEIKIFDIQKNQAFDAQVKGALEIGGIGWY